MPIQQKLLTPPVLNAIYTKIHSTTLLFFTHFGGWITIRKITTTRHCLQEVKSNAPISIFNIIPHGNDKILILLTLGT